MIISALDKELIFECIDGKDIISVQLPNKNRPIYAVFIDPNTFRNNNWGVLGFTINKSYEWFNQCTETDLCDLIHGDRIIRIIKSDKNKFKTIMFIVTNSFYERRIGKKLFNDEG